MNPCVFKFNAYVPSWGGSEGTFSLFDITLEYLQDAFIIQYSLNGSNNRTKEEAIVMHWFEYIYNCKGMLIC